MVDYVRLCEYVFICIGECCVCMCGRARASVPECQYKTTWLCERLDWYAPARSCADGMSFRVEPRLAGARACVEVEMDVAEREGLRREGLGGVGGWGGGAGSGDPQCVCRDVMGSH